MKTLILLISLVLALSIVPGLAQSDNSAKPYTGQGKKDTPPGQAKKEGTGGSVSPGTSTGGTSAGGAAHQPTGAGNAAPANQHGVSYPKEDRNFNNARVDHGTYGRHYVAPRVVVPGVRPYYGPRPYGYRYNNPRACVWRFVNGRRICIR